MALWAGRMLLTGAVVAVLTGIGYQAGRHVERIDALRAGPTEQIAVADKHRAWRCAHPAARVRSVRSDRSDRSDEARR